MEAKHICKPRSKTLLIYHRVFLVKYNRKVFTEEISQSLKRVCMEFGPAYEIHSLEIDIDEDHIHFLFQTTLNITSSKIVAKINKFIK